MTVEPLYTPLVSVIIRTIGRACLTQALESVAAQTYQPIEFVVVDAACRQLQLPAQLSEAVSVRVCTPESALKRSAAQPASDGTVRNSVRKSKKPSFGLG